MHTDKRNITLHRKMCIGVILWFLTYSQPVKFLVFCKLVHTYLNTGVNFDVGDGVDALFLSTLFE